MRISDLKLFDTAIAGVILAAVFMFTIGQAALWVVKPYTPNLMGYSELGWMKKGHQTVLNGAFSVPKWAGAESLVASGTALANHHMIRLQKGQIIEIEAEGEFKAGGIAIYLVTANRLGLGREVQHPASIRLSKNTPSAKIQFTAPTTDYYMLSRHVRWEDHTPDGVGLQMPDYNFVYEVKWRLRRDL